MPNTAIKKRQPGRGRHWFDYVPLIVVLLLTSLSALATQLAYEHPLELEGWMLNFMGFYLVTFSMFKFFDLEGFADGFQMYDLLAKRFRTYAYIYPFIELTLGLCYLAQWQLFIVYNLTILVMVWGFFGVYHALHKGLDIECACMGSILHVPLSTVAMIENVGMAGMSAVMILMMVSS